MLTLMDNKPNQTCAGASRRDFLKAGALGLGGLGMGGLLPALPGIPAAPMVSAAQAASLSKAVTGKSVVFLFLHGGPPHIELFDPKMNAGSEIRSITGEVKTAHPGVTFGGTFPKLAKMADKFTVLRSYQSKNGGHTYNQVMTGGGNDLDATGSAIYARIVGTNNAQTGLPTNTVIYPEAVQNDLKLGRNFETSALPGLTQPGKLGPNFGAFDPAGGGQLKDNMTMRIDPQRLTDRKGLLRRLDNLRRKVDVSGEIDSAHHFQQQAFDVITKGVAEAFDLSKEDQHTLDLYDTRPLFDMKSLTRWNDMRRASNLLGLQMLMARRMVERGAGFVTVSDCGWDYHANNNSPKNMAGIYPMGSQVDQAVSAFITDIRRRGLEDKVLLAVTGEMGRSPRINNNGGREHYGDMTSLLLFGGGLKMGQVVGESDNQAAKPATRPYNPKNLMATIMHTLFDPAEVRLLSDVPDEVKKFITDGEPITEVM